MTAKQALELLRNDTMKAYSELNHATGQKKLKALNRYRQFQSGLEVAEEIYHNESPDSLERIMALKLSLKLGEY